MINKEILVEKIPLLEPKWEKIGSRIYQKVWNESGKSDRMWGAVNAINTLGEERDCSNLNLLDIGCNCGVLSVVASEHFNRVVGIDIDALSIEGAWETTRFFEKNNCLFKPKGVKKYVEDGDFKKDDINAIVAFQVLYLLSDKEVRYLLNRMKNIYSVIFGSRPSKNRSKNKYGLWTLKSINQYLVNPFFKEKRTLYKHKSRWPLVLAYK